MDSTLYHASLYECYPEYGWYGGFQFEEDINPCTDLQDRELLPIVQCRLWSAIINNRLDFSCIRIITPMNLLGYGSQLLSKRQISATENKAEKPCLCLNPERFNMTLKLRKSEYGQHSKQIARTIKIKDFGLGHTKIRSMYTDTNMQNYQVYLRKLMF